MPAIRIDVIAKLVGVKTGRSAAGSPRMPLIER
jgi:hypothetical protein